MVEASTGKQFAAFFQSDRDGTTKGIVLSTHKGDMGMITNERQYQQTRKKLAELDELIVATEAGDAGDDDFRDVQLAGLRSQADDLREEITEYETLRDGGATVIEAASLAGLADALIKARVARGWTQRQLADRLGVAEQQVQRYESSAYRTASLARLCDIADALGVTFTERAELDDPAGVA